MITTYTRQRGETILIPVADDGAIDGGETLITSKVRRVSSPIGIDPDEPVAGIMSVTFRAADSELPDGWLLTLSAADCADLAFGPYRIDMKITDATGVVTITDHALIMIEEPATP